MSEKKPVPGYVWMLAGLAIGLFAAFLVYLSKQPAENISFTESVKQELQKAREQETVEISEPSSIDDSSAEKPANSKPRFEFYTILSELEVFVPEPEIDSKQATKTTAKTDTKILTDSSGEAKNIFCRRAHLKAWRMQNVIKPHWRYSVCSRLYKVSLSTMINGTVYALARSAGRINCMTRLAL